MNNRLKPYLVFIILITGLGFVSGFFSGTTDSHWFNGLIKPEINPPSWIFGPIWTMLYVLMAVAVAIIWNLRFENNLAKQALIIFFVQFFFNLSWSLLFFKIKSPLFALVDVIILWLLIVLTIIKFYNLNKLAGWLLIPYLLWVSFASYLNYLFYILN